MTFSALNLDFQFSIKKKRGSTAAALSILHK